MRVRSITTPWLLAVGLTLPTAGHPQTAPTRTPDVIFVPTPIGVVSAMLTLAGVDTGDVVYDLGSGDGRLVIAAAKHHGARGIGIDIDPVRIAESRRNADTAGVADRVSFRQGDLFQADLSSATVVTLYLTTTLNERLRPKLFRELRPGARVVSNTFAMGAWEADSVLVVEPEATAETTVHFWIMPAAVGGTWRLVVPQSPGGRGRTYKLRLTQRFQRLTGTALVDGATVPLVDPRIRGDSLFFGLADPPTSEGSLLRFAGRVTGGRAEGRVIGGSGVARPWHATRTARQRNWFE